MARETISARAEAERCRIQCLAVTPSAGRSAVIAEVERRRVLFAMARNPNAAAWASVRDDLLHARWRP